MKRTKLAAALLAASMLFGMLAGCTDTNPPSSGDASEPPVVSELTYPATPDELGSGEVKWSEEKTADGWMKVTNEGGSTLGYTEGTGVNLIQVQGFAFKDLNRNGLLDEYEDWRLDVDTRTADLAYMLSGEEIAGLLPHSTQQDIDTDGALAKPLIDAGVRSLLSFATAYPVDIQAKWNNAIQLQAEVLGYGIPINISTNPRTTPVWPNNLALGASFSPDLVEEISRNLAREYRALGISTLLGPQIEISSEPRWPRVDGTFGEDPALSRDMTNASVKGHQSTYADDSTDLGWGVDSVNAMIKHWPGDGAGESGRESHDWYGKFTVYPGGQFETGLIPFIDGGFNSNGATGSAAAIMDSYAIAWNEDGSLGDMVGSAYSKYKNDLARSYGFNGPICTDWGVIDGSAVWGVEDLSVTERIYQAIMAGSDQLGGVSDVSLVVDAYNMAVTELGEEVALERFQQSAARILKTFFQVGLFENPYVSVASAVEIVGGEAAKEAGHEAELQTIVMLKNENHAIAPNESAEKPTVYVPLMHTPPQNKYGGYLILPASAELPIDRAILDRYFNVITDTVSTEFTGPQDADGNPTVAYDDIIRASADELAECDYALVIVRSPDNVAAGTVSAGYDNATESFIPISLQYGPYTANSTSVRTESVSGDMVMQEVVSPYGSQHVEKKQNNSYYGNSAQLVNGTDLNTILYTSENMPEGANVIVAINAKTTMVVNEFESQVDAILMGFEFNGRALLDIVTGQAEPSALLPFQVPANMETVEAQYEDVPRDMECYVDAAGNTYDFAYGLNWDGVISDARTAKYSVAPQTALKSQPVS